jgi:hypothetical protein
MTKHSRQSMTGQHGHQAHGEEHGHAIFTEEQVVDIREKHAAGWSMRALGRAYSVDHATIRKIVIRHTWKHI